MLSARAVRGVCAVSVPCVCAMCAVCVVCRGPSWLAVPGACRVVRCLPACFLCVSSGGHLGRFVSRLSETVPSARGGAARCLRAEHGPLALSGTLRGSGECPRPHSRGVSPWHTGFRGGLRSRVAACLPNRGAWVTGAIRGVHLYNAPPPGFGLPEGDCSVCITGICLGFGVLDGG